VIFINTFHPATHIFIGVTYEVLFCTNNLTSSHRKYLLLCLDLQLLTESISSLTALSNVNLFPYITGLLLV